MKKIAEGDFEFLPHYCQCPCHGLIKLYKNKLSMYERSSYPRFINHHYVRVNPPFYGKHHTPETIEKNRQKHLGNKNAEGHVVSEEQKLKLAELHKGNQYRKGCINSEEHRKIISENNTGKSPWNKDLVGVQESPMKGKHHTPETIEKIKENTPVFSGEDHWNWQNGISYAPYCPKFNNKFKEDIRTRDNRICQLCGKTELENRRRLSVHHIHGDKPNCYPDCISLCNKCNLHVVEKKETKKYYETLLMNKLNERCLLFWSRRREKEKELMMR